MIKLLSTLAAANLCLTASVAEPAGFGFVDVPADPEGPAMRGAVWSPCAMPPQDMVVGRTTLPGVKDCPRATGYLLLSSRTVGAATSLAITTPPRRLPMPASSSPPSVILAIPSLI